MTKRKLTDEQAKARRAKVQDRDRKLNKQASAGLRAAGLTYHAMGPRPDQGDIAARLAEIPNDDRTLTQRICGDPLPGRSALHKRQAELS